MDCQDPLFYAIALQRLPGVGPRLYQLIERQFQNPQGFFQASAHELDLAQIPAVIRQLLSEWRCNPEQHWLSRQTRSDMTWLREHPDVHVLLRDHPDYPPLLKEISNPPPLLYVRGQSSVLTTPQLAMVGARKASSAGCRQAALFAEALVEHGVTITSGLALGIDAACHQAALAAQGRTVAFVATGIDVCYPKRHQHLAGDICLSGAIVTEFPLGTAPKRDHFPRRNRLISGASMGVLVVEAAHKSGSLITAKYALEQSREVFAVPGSIQNPLSRGCNALLKQGAKLVETAEDILEELEGFGCWYSRELLSQKTSTSATSASNKDLFENPEFLSIDEKTLLDSMSYDPVSIDELVMVSGLASPVVSSALVNLEIHGLIECLGSHYQRC